MVLQTDFNFKDQLLGSVRPMRAFAISLCGKPDQADDLVQETLIKAWANQHSFEPGTNLRAWLFTILRNEFYTYLRKRRREVEDADGVIAGNVAVMPQQDGHMNLKDMNAALSQLPPNQREALLLVSASDMSYEEAAAVCQVAVGTIKSRVNRARARLAEVLGLADVNDLGPEPQTRAAMLSDVQDE
jgi:RNA polymerase sigma-70 factor, ECF subfamily